jgi:glycosyltransferase involved in cell wall biosynthesis
MATLTILLPVYNGGSFIKEAVESLLNQTFPDFQLWIIDDGSTDDSRLIIESFTDKRISAFFFDANRGRVVVSNEMVKKITSPFFTVTDADDVSHPMKFERQIKLLQENEQLMMCGTSYLAMNAKGKVFLEVDLPEAQDVIYASMDKHSQFHGPTTVMRTELLTRLPEFYRLYFKDNIADADLASRIVDQFQTANVRETLYAYRIVSNSASRKNVSIRFLTLYKAIRFLSIERRQNVSDSLMKNETYRVDEFMEQEATSYKIDPALLYRHSAFYHLYWHVVDKAWLNGLKAWRKRPFALKNIFLLVNLVTKSVLYVVKDRLVYPYYREYFKRIGK